MVRAKSKRKPPAAKRPRAKRGAEPEVEVPEPELDEVGLEQADALHEAEAELGISEWIDPDTGVPAEDGVPRIEDH